MSLVHVSGYTHVNPTDVSRVDGFPLTLSIVVTMKNGDKLTRYVDEKSIERLTEPSSTDTGKWSIRQRDLFLSLRRTIYPYEGKTIVVGGCPFVIDDDTLATVNGLESLDRDQAFGVVYRQYARLFNAANVG